MDELQHECGIAAIYHLEGPQTSALAPLAGPEQVSRLMPRMLLDLQNRGQLAAGFTTYNPDREQLLDTYKQIGTVIEAFRLNHQAKYDSIMREYAGRAAIGHVRYATCGANDRSYAQPFERHHGCKWKWFALRLQRPAGQLRRASRRTARPGRLPPDARHRHRSHHALPQPRAARRRPARPGRGVPQPEPTKFDGAYNIVFLNAMGDMVVAARPARLPAAVLRPGRPAVRRRQRERGAAQPRLPATCGRWSRAR